jgi:transcriptional regulator with XRE-family HTH domain
VTPQTCREARENLGWTPEQLAAASGLALQTVLRFEAQAQQPRASTLIALRKALRAAGGLARAEPV